MEAKRHWATRFFSTNWNSINLGFTLMETMVTIGLMSIAAMGIMGVNVTAMKANKSASLRADVIDVKRMITNRISCEKTIPTKPAPCVPGIVISLKDKNDSELNPSAKIGEWTVEASCEFLGTPAAPGLSIYATKKIPGSSEYAKDPLRNINFDTSHPSSSLFKPEVRLCSERFSSTPPEGGPVPAGGIVMWSGSPGSIPVGWALCNGTNGTPNLTNRFIMGGGGGLPVEGDGQVTLTGANLPPHQHTISNPIASSRVAIQDGGGDWVSLGYPDPNAWGGGYERLRYFDNPTAYSTEVSGNGQAFTVRPPYYSLAFIMKLP